MELSEAKKVLKEEIWRCTKFEDSRKRIAIEIILKALDNSISKDEVRRKIEILDYLQEDAIEENALEDARILGYKIKILQELLGEE